MKTMTKYIVVVAMFIGLLAVGKANAGTGIFTSTYTSVVVTGSSPAALSSQSSGGDMELCWIAYSSASSSPNDSWLFLFDTPTVYNTNIYGQDPVPMGSKYGDATGGPTRWPPSQMILPPIILFSTASGTGATYGGYWTRLDFTDAQGNGIPIASNLVALKAGTDYGTVITYGIRKRRTSVEH